MCYVVWAYIVIGVIAFIFVPSSTDKKPKTKKERYLENQRLKELEEEKELEELSRKCNLVIDD